MEIVLAWTQGVYYLVTGIWPLVSMRSFLWVTGPKTDLWLVRTVGVLILAMSLSLLAAAARSRVDLPTAILGAFAAAFLTLIDTVYVLIGRISKIYLLDAVAEIVIVAAWAVSWLAVIVGV